MVAGLERQEAGWQVCRPEWLRVLRPGWLSAQVASEGQGVGCPALTSTLLCQINRMSPHCDTLYKRDSGSLPDCTLLRA